MEHIIAPDGEAAENAKRVIRSVTADPELGAIYLGKVKVSLTLVHSLKFVLD